MNIVRALQTYAALAALSAITDAVAAQGKVGGDAKEQIDGIGLALQQMLFKGCVSGEEITQLAERQVKVYKYLGDEIAKTDQSFASLTDDERIAKVQELGQRGLLNAKAAVAAILRGIQAEYGGTAERIAKETLSGIESNTADRFSRLAGQATGNAFEEYKKKRQAFLDLLNSSSGDAVASGINKTTGEVLKAMDAAVDALRTGNLKGLGISAITSAAEGVKQGAKSLYDEGTAAAGQLVNGIMDRLDMHSPSKVMIALGVEAGHSFLFGVQAGIRGGNFSDEIEKLIEENARRTGLPPELIRAVIRQESGGKKAAHSPVGAQGLMQLMPATAARFGVTNPFDAKQNIAGGAQYLAWLLHRFSGDIPLALAGYNAGEGAVDKYHGIPPYRETRGYVSSVMAQYNRLRGARGGTVSPAEELAGLQQRDAREHGGLPVYVTNAAELAGLRTRDEREHGGDERAGLLARDISEHGDPLVTYVKIPIWKKGKIVGYEALDPSDARAVEFQGLQARDETQFGSEPPINPRSVQDIIGLVPGVDVPQRVRALTGALTGTQQTAALISDEFKDWTGLINNAGVEAKQEQKEFEATTRAIAQVGGDVLQDLLTRGPREAFRTLRHDFLSLVVNMGRDWFESSLFKSLTGTGSAATGQSGGGGVLGGLFRRIFGGGSSAQTTAPFNPNAGSFFGPVNGGRAVNLNSVSDYLTSIGGSGITAPASASAASQVSGRFASLFNFGNSAAGSAAGAGRFSLRGLGSSLGALAPPLGLSLGSSLGRGSGLGSILGGAGGLLLGGTAAALLGINNRRGRQSMSQLNRYGHRRTPSGHYRVVGR